MNKIFISGQLVIALFGIFACSSTNIKDHVSMPESEVAEGIILESVVKRPQTYFNEKYRFSFEYPSGREILDEGTAGIGASLSIVILKKHEAIDAPGAITVRIYEKPVWSETDGWIGEDDSTAKIITHGNLLAQIYRGADGDMPTMEMVRSTFHFIE